MKKIGILGGGQLGRMLLQSAIDFDLNISVLDPDPHCPSANLANNFVVGSFHDYETVLAFGRGLDVLTIEIEAVNLLALKQLQLEGVLVFPQPEVIEIIQDKRHQKQFFKENSLPTSDFVLTENAEDTRNFTDFLPAFHKLGQGGYDGRGVQRIATPDDFQLAFDAPGILEKAVDFDKELAVIVARNVSGEVACFPTVEMAFHPTANLVEYLFSPADITQKLHQEAQQLAIKTAEAFGIVGLLAVEMFLTKDGQLLINEVAPRPHNSGHHTQRANDVSQFEQHLRAILDWPLGKTESHFFAGMLNILGSEGHSGPAIYKGLEKLIAEPGVHPFLYGKKTTKPFRKMGHITLLASTLAELQAKAERMKNALKVIAE